MVDDEERGMSFDSYTDKMMMNSLRIVFWAIVINQIIFFFTDFNMLNYIRSINP